MKSLNDVLTIIIDQKDSKRIPTGFKELDSILKGGIKPNGVTLVAGRPGMGMQSFMLDVAMHYAKTTGKKVAYFSFEQAFGGEESVVLRILGKAYKSPMEYRYIYLVNDIKKRLYVDKANVLAACEEIRDLPILVCWNPDITPVEIEEMCENIEDLGMVIVNPQGVFDRGIITSDYIFRLSRIAMYLHVPVLCSCNVSRNIEYCDDRRPNLCSVLMEGLDPDTPPPTVIALYRESYYNRADYEADTDCRPAEAIVITFGRKGGGGTAHLLWDMDREKFLDPCENKEKRCNDLNMHQGSNRWIVLSDYGPATEDRPQSKENRYEHIIHITEDNFNAAKEYFLEQMMEFDSDGVLNDIREIMDDWEYARGEITIDTIIEGLMTDLNTEIDEQGYRASGYARLGKTASGWETLSFKYFNSEYHFTVSKNCFEMKEPSDKYFFEVMYEEEGTGELKPYFYMELKPSL